MISLAQAVLTFDPPNQKQQMFLTATNREIAYGGARGGGKSWAVRVKACLLCLSYPGIRVLIVRRSYPELVQNHINILREMLFGIARYNKTEKVFNFPNKSEIHFGYCAADSDVDQYQGLEVDCLFFDEACLLREEWIRKIKACVRGTNGYPKRIYYTLNPGGPSHGYFKNRFIDRRFEANENPEDFRFIQSLVTDNTALMKTNPEYIEELRSLPPKLRRAWLEGSWDIFDGQYFEEFKDNPEGYLTRKYTHVIEPFDLSSPQYDGWTFYRSYDFGYGKPFSCGWWAIDYDGVAYRILELYGCTDTPTEGVKWTPDKQFAEIRRIEETHPWLKGRQVLGVADPSIWDGSRGESVNDAAVRHQVFFDRGVNDRVAGWMQMHYRFQFDENGYARMYFFRGCNAAIRTVPLMMYDPRDPEDLDTSLEDHACDEIRYFCMCRPIKPHIKVEQKSLLNDPLDMFADARRPQRWTYLI